METTDELFDRFRKALTDIYCFYYFASFGIASQRNLIATKLSVLRVQLEKIAGREKAAEYLNGSSVGFVDGWPPFAAGVREFVRLPVNDVFTNSVREGPYEERLRQYALVLLTSIWESDFRPAIARLIGLENKDFVRSDYWAAINSLRNGLVHHHGMLVAPLRNVSFASDFPPNKPISIGRTAFDRLIEAAYAETIRLAQFVSTFVRPLKE
jgi:hypothetical protein